MSKEVWETNSFTEEVPTFSEFVLCHFSLRWFGFPMTHIILHPEHPGQKLKSFSWKTFVLCDYTIAENSGICQINFPVSG